MVLVVVVIGIFGVFVLILIFVRMVEIGFDLDDVGVVGCLVLD